VGGNGFNTHSKTKTTFFLVRIFGRHSDFRLSWLDFTAADMSKGKMLGSGQRLVSGVSGVGIVWDQHVGLGWTGVLRSVPVWRLSLSAES
jgi:hypothetical protein